MVGCKCLFSKGLQEAVANGAQLGAWRWTTTVQGCHSLAKSRLVSNDSNALASSHNLDVSHFSHIVHRMNPRHLSLNFGDKSYSIVSAIRQ